MSQRCARRSRSVGCSRRATRRIRGRAFLQLGEHLDDVVGVSTARWCRPRTPVLEPQLLVLLVGDRRHVQHALDVPLQVASLQLHLQAVQPS